MGNKNVTLRYEKVTNRWSNSCAVVAQESSRTSTFSRTAGDNPNWRRLVSAGLNAANSYQATLLVYDKLVQNKWTTVGSIRSCPPWCTAAFPSSPVSPPSGDLTAARQVSTVRLLKQIRDRESSLSGMTFLGELRETVKMIRHPGKSLFDLHERYLRRVARAAKGRRQKHADQSRFLDAIAGEWLEVQFGVKPLVGDIAAYAESLLLDMTPRVVTLRAMGQVESATTTGPSKAAAGVYFLDQTQNRFTSRVVSRCGLAVNVDGPPASALEHLRKQARLNDWQDFVPTVWELIPMSVFVDYFINVNTILEASFTSTRNMRWSNQTSLTQCYTTRILIPDDASYRSASGDSKASFKGGTYQHSSLRGTYLRSGLVMQVPNLQFSLPSVGQAINLAAFSKLVSSTSALARSAAHGDHLSFNKRSR